MTVSRREFLAGSAAAAAAPHLTRPGWTPPRPETKRLGPGAVAITLNVNGEARSLEVEPRTTLIEALRWQLGLIGPKEVCDRGACGACTILIDDKPMLGCMSLAVDAVGKQITTVEGLGSPEEPGKVQSAFIQHDAVQCGYCIPGMVTAMEAVLRRNPQASVDEVREGLSGNLCRCGTYNKVFEAAARAVGLDPEAGFPAQNAPACMENESSRIDGPAKITGRAVYGADVRREDMLFASWVLCPYGIAELVSADVETVRRLPGVIDISIKAGQKYEYNGAPVGYVCAESPAALRDALTALRLEWKPEAPVTDFKALHEEQYGSIPPDPASLKGRQKEQWEAAEEALQKADVVLERTYATQIQVHSSLEPHGGTVDPNTQPAEAWMSTQGTFTCVGGIAKELDVRNSEVAIKCDYVGGGFGSKFGPGREGQLAARLAKKHGRPVRVFNDRESEQIDTGNRPGSLQWMQIGVRRDGKLLGGHVHVGGIVGVGGRGGASNPAHYDFGETSKTEVHVKAHHGAARAFRAPGRPQGVFAVDSMMDELADAIGMDPVEFRKINETSEVRKEMLERGAQEIGWQRRQPTGSQLGRLRRGIGCAVGDWFNGRGRCQIRLKARRDGIVELYSGVQDIGTGTRTVLAAITADALNLPREAIEVHMADSRYPNGPASGGSTVSRVIAPTARDAAANLLDELDLPSVPESQEAWREICRGLPEDGLTAEGNFNQEYWGEGGSEAVQFVEVVVDAETGVVQCERVVALQNCGLVANRLTSENQLIGGVIQGLSYALFEDRATDPQLGYMLNADLEHYKIAGALDIPEIVPLLWGDKSGKGVRSLGEPATVPTAAAIANAVANALGVRVRSIPITPQAVLRTMEEQA